MRTSVLLVSSLAIVALAGAASAETFNPQPDPPGRSRVRLNPQPEPPGRARVMLNPQPEPPGRSRGVMLNPQPLPPGARGHGGQPK